MPPLLVSLPLGVLSALQGVLNQETLGELTVVWRKKSIEVIQRIEREPDGAERAVERLLLRFEGGVSARFGLTTVHSDSLVLISSDGTAGGVSEALAEGAVRLEDPEGRLEADRLEFQWNSGTGKASGVRVYVGDLFVSAERASLSPGKWELLGVSAEICRGRLPVLSLTSPAATMESANRVILRNLTVRLFGNRIGTLPKYVASSGDSGPGTSIPAIALASGRGVRVRWNGSLDVAHRTLAFGRLSASLGRTPTISAYLTHSFAPGGASSGFSSPRSDLSERFGDSYLDNVFVSSPQSERARVGSERATVSVGTAWNQGASGNPAGGRVSKPLEFVAESSTTSAGWAVFGQARMQRIGFADQASIERSLITTTVLAPPLWVGSSAYIQLRGDGRSFASDAGDSGWQRAQASLILDLSAAIRLSVGYSVGSQFGEPDFEFDRLARKRTFHMRSDWSEGGTSIGVLAKYDAQSRDWFDHEFRISKTIGCFEPFVGWRESPRRFEFGLNFRSFDEFRAAVGRIGRRSQANMPKASASSKKLGAPPSRSEGHGPVESRLDW